MIINKLTVFFCTIKNIRLLSQNRVKVQQFPMWHTPCCNMGKRIKRIKRIKADFFKKFVQIRSNPFNPFNPFSYHAVF